jgi:hypothetical protein
MTTRRWMIAVAVVAAVLESWRLWDRSTTYRERADQLNFVLRRIPRAIEEERERQARRREPITSSHLARIAEMRAFEAYYSALQRNHRYVASHPWAPDPPEPAPPHEPQ